MNKFWSKKVFVVLDSILLLAVLVLPAIFDAMYDVGSSFVFTSIAAIIYSVIPLAFSVFLFIKKSK
jgi:drug/metabolite transporter (DMT)-like permease